ncbi:MAG: TrpB-like pyridoxal phosphate-dependent enzyme [Candidatus Brocadiia bacterium]
MPDDAHKILLSEAEIPSAWYNIMPDLPEPPVPPIHPATHQPINPEDLLPLFPMGLIEQEASQERWIDIPGEVLDVLRLWRPTPLHRARRLETALQTPARIYYKNESVSPPGSHKPNTAVAQAYYNKQEGVRRLTTETGAGQWGSALSFACNLFDLECLVYMVKVSFEQKPYRKLMMQTWGADILPSPSDTTQAGRNILASDPECPGSLGIAISEAIEVAAGNDDTKYSLGSVLNHVLLHQTIVGLETQKQLEKVDEQPDVLIGCVGGGSNYAGFCFPFYPLKFGGKDIRFLATEPTACPTMTRGTYTYDFGDTAKTTPLLKMYTLGHGFVPPKIHAGGLRYHGMAPLISLLVKTGQMEPLAFHQNPVFEAAITFARAEGIIPAPETAHAVKAAIDEAIRCREAGEDKCIVLNFSGHGHFDLGAFERYFAKDLEDYEYPEENIAEAMKDVPAIE